MTIAMFALTALLWGCGALMTAFQNGIVPAPVSVAYRMAAAGLLLLSWSRINHIRLDVRRTDALWVAAQGVLFFGFAFTAFYEATQRIASGLAALLLSTSSIFAALLGWAILGIPVTRRVLGGAAIGVVGVALIFAPQLTALYDGHAGRPHGAFDLQYASGLAWAMVAAIATAAGTVLGARNQRRGIAASVILGWGALVGALFCAAWAFATHAAFTFDPSLRYIGSLLYLAVAASCGAFMLYFELVQRLGPGRAAYSLSLVPVIALTLSTLFEGLTPTAWIIAGAATILLGNVIVLKR